jgi:bacterioferritin
VDRLNKGLELCRTHGDNGTRLLLEEILKSEEEHIDWIEAQLTQIRGARAPNYLAQQLE